MGYISETNARGVLDVPTAAISVQQLKPANESHGYVARLMSRLSLRP